MKTIGICIPTIEGGTVCHQEIGREAARRGVDYPEIVTHTPLFAAVARSAVHDDFTGLAEALAASINRTAQAGADFAIIPSNTVHFVFDEIAARAKIPVMSIVAVTADHCARAGYRRVGVMGTLPTMRRRLYDAALAARGVEALYPSADRQGDIARIITEELIRGDFRDASTARLEAIARALAGEADAVILGCTELPLVMTEAGCGAPLVDTTRILARTALDAAISG